MNKERDHYYTILELQSEASPDEIKAAYRRLAKLYHPDHDSSLDAEMKYKEVRAAYDVLKRMTEAQAETSAASYGSSPPNAGYSTADKWQHGSTAKYYGTVRGKDWWYIENDGEDEFDFNDLMWENEGVKRPKKRLPFSLENLPRIFRISFKEIFDVGMTVRFLLMALGLWITLLGVGWGSLMTFCAILFVLSGALLYRYYFQFFGSRFPVLHIVNTLLCSVALAILCTAATSQTYVVLQIEGRLLRSSHIFYGSSPIFIYLFWWIFTYLLLLWVRPFWWLCVIYAFLFTMSCSLMVTLFRYLWG